MHRVCTMNNKMDKCKMDPPTHLEGLHTPSEGGGIEEPTHFGHLGTGYKCKISQFRDLRAWCITKDNDEDRHDEFYEYVPNTMNEKQSWRGTIYPYWEDIEDELGLQLCAQSSETGASSRQTKGKKGRGAAKVKQPTLKERRRQRSMEKQLRTGYRQHRGMRRNSCFFDVGSREDFRGQRRQPGCFPERTVLPYHCGSALPDEVLFDRPHANVGPPLIRGKIFDFEPFTRTSSFTKEHREKVIERARKVYRQRCLNRERASNKGREKSSGADKMEQSRAIEIPDHKEDVTEESKEAQTLTRLKRNKGDKYKVTEFDLWSSDTSEDKSKITRRKKTGKTGKKKRKEKRQANKESSKVALGIHSQEETEVASEDYSNNESSEERCRSLEIRERDNMEDQTEGKHENFSSNDRNDLESKMENSPTELVKAIGNTHSEEINSENVQQVEKIREQSKPIESVEERNMEQQTVSHFPLETPSVHPEFYNSAAESKERDHTNLGAVEHVIGKTSQESSSREPGPTYPEDSAPNVAYYSRPNGGVGSPRAKVSAAAAATADRRTRSADWENMQRGRQNEANWRWREDSAAAGDWACHNKAENGDARSQRSKRNHSRDQGDSDGNGCGPYEEGISALCVHTDGPTVTVNESRFNRRDRRQQSRQLRKPRKLRSRGHLSSSSLSSNWRSKNDEIENDSINEDLQRKGSWEANNAVCESDRLCDPAVLVSPPKPEPHIRNRRLSPGSGIGGGGGGGCTAGPDQQLRQASPLAPEATLNGTGQPFAFVHHRERERRGGPTRGRGPRRENPRSSGRPGGDNKAQRPVPVPKARWVEDSLSLLKPPPAFPVKDSPAKLQPAVSYASKVKAGGGASGGTEEPPGIGVLLQNQWGLSFISDGPAENNPSAAAQAPAPGQAIDPAQAATTPETAASHPAPHSHPVTGDMDSEKPAPTPTFSAPATPAFSIELCNRQDESSGELLLTCRHLVEAMQYHVQEWNTVYNRQKEDPAKVVWYKNSLEQPA